MRPREGVDLVIGRIIFRVCNEQNDIFNNRQSEASGLKENQNERKREEKKTFKTALGLRAILQHRSRIYPARKCCHL